MIMAAEDIDLDAEPEEGALGDLAEAMDKLREAERRAAKSTKNMIQANEVVSGIKTRIEAAHNQSGMEDERLARLKTELDLAETAAESAFRNAAKDKAKAEDAAKQVHQLGGPSPDQPQEDN